MVQCKRGEREIAGENDRWTERQAARPRGLKEKVYQEKKVGVRQADWLRKRRVPKRSGVKGCGGERSIKRRNEWGMVQ